MTQYNSLNVKLPSSQLNNFKSAIKNETEVVLRLSSNMIGDNEAHFPQGKGKGIVRAGNDYPSQNNKMDF